MVMEISVCVQLALTVWISGREGMAGESIYAMTGLKKRKKGMPLVVSRGPYLLKTPLPPSHTMGSQSDTLHVQLCTYIAESRSAPALGS